VERQVCLVVRHARKRGLCSMAWHGRMKEVGVVGRRRGHREGSRGGVVYSAAHKEELARCRQCGVRGCGAGAAELVVSSVRGGAAA